MFAFLRAIPGHDTMTNIVTRLLLILSLAFAGAAFLPADQAIAFDAPPKDQGHSGPNGDDEDDENPDDPDQDEEGDPVQLKSGNFTMMSEDVALDSFALPISVQRNYNSMDFVNDGPMGLGWSMSYVMSLQEVNEYIQNGDSITIRIRVILRDDMGVRHTFFPIFQQSGNNISIVGWRGARQRYGSLTKTGDGRFTWERKDGIQFRFVSGRLNEIVDTNGNRLTFQYDNTGKITRATNPAGRFVTYAYNSANKVASVTDNIGRTVSYTYDSGNRLASVTNQIGNTTTYGYDASGRLNSITSPGGTEILSNTYDDKGRVTAQTAYGASFTYTYNTSYTRVRNSRNFYSDHYFNDFGNPIRIRDLRGNNKYMTWNDEGDMTSIRDQRNNTTSFTYDTDGNILTQTAPDGAVTTYTYGAQARITGMTDPLGRTTSFTYDTRGNLASITDPLGQVETFTHDSAGRLLTATDESGAVASYAYNAAGDIVSMTDENGLTELIGRDAVGRIISETNPAGGLTTFAYNGRNRQISMTDPLGAVTAYAYNANDEQISETDPLGASTTRVFDPFGRVLSVSDPLNNTTTFAYDSLANVTSVTDPEGRTTSRTYDSGNLLSTVTRHDGSTLSFTYDQVGNLATSTDPNGNATSFAYDSLNRMTQVTYADGTTQTMAYDLAGRVTQMVDRKGQTFTYAYDALDRRISITLPNDGTITYGYDSGDNLTSITGYEGTKTFAYDAGDRQTSETSVWGDVMNLGYDADGRLTSLARPGRYTASYAYDADGRMTSAVLPSGTSSFTYDADDRMLTETLPNGVTVSFTYDAADRLTQVRHTAPDGTTILNQNSYAYDQSSLVTSMTELDGTTHAYSYDGMLRLVGETTTPGGGGAATTTTWTYDGNGNRLTQTKNGTTTTFSYNAVDELTSDTAGVTYSYDDNGNLLTAVSAGGTDTFAYDDLNRLTALSGPSATTPLSYGYDGQGRRVRRNVGAAETREVRWGERLIEEKIGAVPQARYDYTVGLSALDGNAGTRFFMFDGIGGTRALTSAAGAVTDTYGLAAHGTDVTETGATPNPFIFNGAFGYFREDAADFYHVGARFYDGGTGRFLQTDPVRQGFNPYRHALNNPVNFNDPSGEILPLIAWCARGAAASLIEDEIMHHVFDGKEERTWTDRLVSGGLGCLTGGFGNKARRAGRAADKASDAARRCRGGRCNICSFDGDTMVITDAGLVPIRDVDAETMDILSKDEATGELIFRDILDHYSNTYEETVRLEIENSDGGVQTIVSNTIHPFFAVPRAEAVSTVSSEGAIYRGDIPGGAWIDAADLRPGALLLTATGEWSRVLEVRITKEELVAFNMNVDVNDSYFVTEHSAEDAVWVHNCNHIPKPNRGRGSVPKDKRDKKRTWTKKEKEAHHKKNDEKCEQCGKKTDIDDIDGHHKDRHADGGKTDDDNLATVCKPCHKDLHRK